MPTKPEVFIVESLTFEDEKEQQYEGRILTDILRLGGKDPHYYYVRTKRELEAILDRFEESECRYLHLSCHGNRTALGTTLDVIPVRELRTILNPYLEGRRLFLSTCNAANRQLANVLNGSGCLSIVGPCEEVTFNKAAILWASFYHLAFESDAKRMQGADIANILKDLAPLFGVHMAYFTKATDTKIGYRRRTY